VQSAALQPPVSIALPSGANVTWTAKSDTQNRPLRVELTLDGAQPAIVSRHDFSQRPLLDRVIDTGVAAHEGQLFAPLNQLLGLFTAVSLWLVCISAIVMWWRRRPAGVLGAPPPSPARGSWSVGRGAGVPGIGGTPATTPEAVTVTIHDMFAPVAAQLRATAGNAHPNNPDPSSGGKRHPFSAGRAIQRRRGRRQLGHNHARRRRAFRCAQRQFARRTIEAAAGWDGVLREKLTAIASAGADCIHGGSANMVGEYRAALFVPGQLGRLERWQPGPTRV